MYLIERIRNKKSIDLSLELNINNYDQWLKSRLNDLMEQIKQTEKLIKLRKKIAKDFTFPFSKPREGQRDSSMEMDRLILSSLVKNNIALALRIPAAKED